MQNENILLNVVGIDKVFPLDKQELHAVCDVSFSLNRGECLGIVGESGCGKSTLARILVGNLKATSGKMYLNGKEYSALKGKERREFRRNIQMVFQDPLGSFSPRMKIGAYLAESRRNYDRIARDQADREAEELLTMVGLPTDFKNRFPHQLSGGQLQRVAIARAISIHPQLLICDEATGALDVSIQNQVAALLVELVEKNRIGCLFIGHDLALVRSVSQRIAVMYLGRIVEVLESEHLTKTASHPYTLALLDSIFDVYCDRKDEVTLLRGEPPSPLKVQAGCAFSARCSRCTEQCLREIPPLQAVGRGHQVACHNPVTRNDETSDILRKHHNAPLT